MADNIVIFNFIVKSRIDSVDKRAVLSELIFQKGGSVQNQLLGICSVHCYLSAAVIQALIAQRINLVLFIAEPTLALKENIGFRQLFQRRAVGYPQVAVEIIQIDAAVFIIIDFSAVELRLQQSDVKAAVKSQTKAIKLVPSGQNLPLQLLRFDGFGKIDHVGLHPDWVIIPPFQKGGGFLIRLLPGGAQIRPCSAENAGPLLLIAQGEKHRLTCLAAGWAFA